jgi:hypothetical protein
MRAGAGRSKGTPDEWLRLASMLLPYLAQRKPRPTDLQFAKPDATALVANCESGLAYLHGIQAVKQICLFSQSLYSWCTLPLQARNEACQGCLDDDNTAGGHLSGAGRLLSVRIGPGPVFEAQWSAAVGR